MSIYDKSSLVLIPSGTKTGKVYSQKPVSGDGDFTFTRSSAATRVNADGNIEKETQNLLLQSNTFDTTWVNYNSTETSGHSGYDGSNDAWLLNKTGLYGQLNVNPSTSGLQTYSIYAKSGSLDFLMLRYRTTSTTYHGTYFDLANGLVGSQTSDVIHSSITSVANGWYRCSITFNASINIAYIYAVDSDGGIANGNTGNIYIQDAQLEQGLVARDYIETTTAAVEGGITDNVPRLDYTDSSCPSLKLEPQRTNVLTQSEYLADSGWSPTFVSVTQNYGTSPEGVQNSTRLVLSSTASSRMAEGLTLTDGTTYTFSCYYKGTAGEIVAMRGLGSGGSGTDVVKTITLTGEWQREDLQFVAGSTSNVVYVVDSRMITDPDEASDFEVYGVQVEAGSYATSYIPTYGSSVTRVVDSCLDGGDSNVFDNDTAVWFIDIERIGTDSAVIGDSLSLRDSSNVRQITLWFDAPTKQIRFRDGKNSFTTIGSSGGAISTPDNTRIKIALKIDGTTLKVFADGVQKGSNYTRPTAFDITQMDMEGKGYKIRNIQFLNSTLTDQEMIDLTTL